MYCTLRYCLQVQVLRLPLVVRNVCLLQIALVVPRSRELGDRLCLKVRQWCLYLGD